MRGMSELSSLVLLLSSILVILMLCAKAMQGEDNKEWDPGPRRRRLISSSSSQEYHLFAEFSSPAVATTSTLCSDFSSYLASLLLTNRSQQSIIATGAGFCGTIPSSLITNFTSLRVLELGDNRLSGGFPVELLSLPALELLNVSGNLLTLGGLALSSADSAAAANFTCTTLRSLDLSSNLLSGGSVPIALVACKNLTYLSLANNSLVGGIPNELGQLLQLETLDLSSNNLTGDIPVSLLNLPAISRIDLHSNELSGALPESLPPSSSHSYFLELDNNSFSGEIPPSLCQFLGSNLSVGSNPELCKPPGRTACQFLLYPTSDCTISQLAPTQLLPVPPPPLHQNSDSNFNLKITWVSVAGVIVLLASMSAVLWCKAHIQCHRNWDAAATSSEESSSADADSCWPLACIRLVYLPLYKPNPDRKKMALIRRTLNISSSSSTHIRTFSYKELSKATARFTNVIGTGGSGVVYKGMLPGGVAIAVKQQQCGDDSSKDSDEQMLQEIKILSELSHPHLLPLLGYYMPGSSKRRMMLVYEYMPKGTLEDHLFGQFSHHRALGWRTRVRIAYESASAIAYLHTQKAGRSIIHRDIKSSNILLDERFHAKVGDFGLSKVIMSNKDDDDDDGGGGGGGGGGDDDDDDDNDEDDDNIPHVTCTSVKGTTGYLDPFYNISQKLTHKSDVYSFGVVLLELVTGKRAFDENRPENEWHLPFWVDATLPLCGPEGLLDSRIPRGTYMEEVVDTMVECGRACCNFQRQDERPSMTQIQGIIQNCLALESKPRNPIDILSRLGAAASSPMSSPRFARPQQPTAKLA